MKYIIVVDMQNDFLTGPLGSEEAAAIIPNVKNYLLEHANKNTTVIFTADTHEDVTYEETIEGKKLPVKHCICNTEGWLIESSILDTVADKSNDYAHTQVICKNTFGAIYLIDHIFDRIEEDETNYPTSFEIMGVCTNICVINNAMLLKAYFPNIPITVKSSLCAGTSEEAHNNALAAMRDCHIDVE